VPSLQNIYILCKIAAVKNQMIILEPFSDEDFNRLISWIENEEDMIQFAGSIFSYPLTHEQLNKYIQEDSRKVFRIRSKASNEIIGHCELNYQEETPKLCRILIGPKAERSKGLGKYIVQEMTRRIMSDPKVNAVGLNVFDWNTGAIKCYERQGFVIQANKDKVMRVGNKTWRSVYMRYQRD
jgi:RimJ/RimL family protein N-acetyltransferase